MKKLKCLGSYIKSRLPLLLLAVCIISCAIASAVYAKYVKSQDKDIILDITGSGGVNINVAEKDDGDGEDNSYEIKNDSNIPVYIRYTVIVNWKSTLTEALWYIPPSAYDVTPLEHSQELSDGYYYCRLKLTDDTYTANIPPDATLGTIGVTVSSTKPSPEYELYVQVLAEAIQCEPANVVTDAWGAEFNTATSTWTKP